MGCRLEYQSSLDSWSTQSSVDSWSTQSSLETSLTVRDAVLAALSDAGVTTGALAVLTGYSQVLTHLLVEAVALA